MTQTFDALWERSAPKLRKFAYSLAKNRDDAEDLVSDAYIKCRRSFSGVRDTKVFEIYVLRAVHRLYVDQYRKYKPLSFTNRAVVDLAGQVLDGDEWGDLYFVKSEDFTECHVEETLDSLAPKERTITQLRMMGLEFHEIAEAMGLSMTAVKSRHMRLRHNLRIAGYAA
jgi:RNA polymerase sigma-70 factor (ECF subfamily)